MAEDDWWTGLVVPAGGGKSGMSGAENTELSKAREQNQAGRSVFPALAELYRAAAKYPGGNPNANLSRSLFGLGDYSAQTMDYANFKRMQLRAAIPKAKLLGVNPSNKDMENILKAQASPEDRFVNNRTAIGLDYSEAARKYFENAFKQRWAAQNGGLNGRDKQGHSYAEALQTAFNRPEVRTLITPPWDRQAVPATNSDVDAILKRHGVIQ